jgi:hypothetical protein
MSRAVTVDTGNTEIKPFGTGLDEEKNGRLRGRFLKQWNLGVALSSSPACPKLGHSVVKTFFYILRKRASSGRA